MQVEEACQLHMDCLPSIWMEIHPPTLAQGHGSSLVGNLPPAGGGKRLLAPGTFGTSSRGRREEWAGRRSLPDRGRPRLPVHATRRVGALDLVLSVPAGTATGSAAPAGSWARRSPRRRQRWTGASAAPAGGAEGGGGGGGPPGGGSPGGGGGSPGGGSPAGGSACGTGASPSAGSMTGSAGANVGWRERRLRHGLRPGAGGADRTLRTHPDQVAEDLRKSSGERE